MHRSDITRYTTNSFTQYNPNYDDLYNYPPPPVAEADTDATTAAVATESIFAAKRNANALLLQIPLVDDYNKDRPDNVTIHKVCFV